MQPMNQGIETTRKLYRKALLQRTFTAYDAIKSNPNDDQPDDDWTCSDMYKAVHKTAGQEVKNNFGTFVLADAVALVVAAATDREIIDSVGSPDKDEEPVDEEPTMVQMREYLHLL
ncbi:hypothetical protein HPB52_025627 [Rhipicephalus sanguineus]|uniref:Uncharacterized protein n=1 Tax=Rhipicephalus sanguineus TaxID=34632 RepID=A0A9D4TCP1_RHISA|nr:hypothetical protein HPB52_025627 [Rhipicephalus sanguineus]